MTGNAKSAVASNLASALNDVGLRQARQESNVPAIFFRRVGDVIQFFQPHLMRRGGIVRIGGSIGFSLRIDIVDEGDAGPVLDPTSECSVSIRIENNIGLMLAGIMDNQRAGQMASFASSLIEALSATLPSSNALAKAMLRDDSSWLSRIVKGDPGRYQAMLDLAERD